MAPWICQIWAVWRASIGTALMRPGGHGMRGSVRWGGRVRLCWVVGMMTLLSGSALAQDAGEERAIAEAEANRIRENMAALAAKNAWKGVDMKYEDLLGLGVPLSQRDHHAGAEAAQNLGDVLAQRERLAAAGTAGDEEVWPTVKEIDDSYGRLYLLGDGEFTVAQMPFDPGPRSAIALASEELARQSAFHGLLPVGSYTFSGFSVEVESNVRPVLITDAGIAPLRDPLGAIQPQGELWLWNGVELDWTETRAVLYTRPESAAVLQGSSRERAAALGLVGAGLASLALGQVVCEHPSHCRQAGMVGGTVAIGAAVPLMVRARSDKRRAVRAWTDAWANHERGN